MQPTDSGENDLIALQGETKRPWPPERGWPLFIWWMAGTIAASLVGSILWAAMQFGSGTSYNSGARIMFSLVAVAGHAWQAWLILRSHRVRLVCWSLLPLSTLLFPLSRVQYTSLAVPLIEAALLHRVRQRPWVWIFAGMFSAVITTAFNLFVWRNYATSLSVGGLTQMSWLNPIIMSAAPRGVWLLVEAVSVWALAFWMPPVRSTPPPLSLAPGQ